MTATTNTKASIMTPFKRQNVRPPLDQPSMTDTNGNVVPYSREGARKVKAKREALALRNKRGESMTRGQRTRTPSRRRGGT